MADDIERHLGGLPITARRSAVGERIWTLATRNTRAPAVALAAAAIVLALVVAAGLLAPRGSNSTAAPPIGSLAVLPLVNTGGDPELDFLVEGMTGGLINRLSGIPQLKVIARDSAYRYQGSPGEYGEVARQLGVGAVLAGDVALSGGNVLVSVELIDTGSQRRLWAQRYEQPRAQIQILEASVARGVVDSLGLQLSGPRQTRFGQAFTADSEAYQLYLRGRYVWNKRRADDFRKSIGYFEQALERDPRFALAHSGLADAYSLLTEYHAEPASDTYPKAKQAALAALALDQDLAEAHTSLAYVRQFYEWDWVAAEREFRRAIELNPNYATAHQWFAEFLTAMGRHDEALLSIRRAAQLDPLSLIINSVEAHLLYMARRYDEAIEKGRQIITMESDFPEVYEYLKRSYDQKGLYAQAIEARQTRRRLLGRPTDETPALRAAASTTVQNVYWRNRLAQELTEGIDEGLQPFEMAELMAQVGNTSQALDWLERACTEHDFMVMYIRVAPNLDPLRREARFQKLLQRRCQS